MTCCMTDWPNDERHATKLTVSNTRALKRKVYRLKYAVSKIHALAKLREL